MMIQIALNSITTAIPAASQSLGMLELFLLKSTEGQENLMHLTTSYQHGWAD